MIEDYNKKKMNKAATSSNLHLFAKLYLVKALKYLFIFYSFYLGYQLIFTENLLDYYLDLLSQKEKVNLFTKNSLRRLYEEMNEVVKAEYESI